LSLLEYLGLGNELDILCVGKIHAACFLRKLAKL